MAECFLENSGLCLVEQEQSDKFGFHAAV